MKVIVAEKCGFCPGVRNANRMAEKILVEEKDVYSLGRLGTYTYNIDIEGIILQAFEIIKRLK